MARDSNQHFEKSLMEVVKNRYSVRTYIPKKLDVDTKDKIKKYIEEIKGPFFPRVRLKLIDSSMITQKNKGKIGTYGVIKGAQDYIAAIVEVGEHNLEQLGYILEKLILYVTSIGLGTCWLGGTFKKSEFSKLVELRDSEIMPIVTPIGYPEAKKSMMESFMRFVAGSNNRKAWNELFFNESFQKSLEKEEIPKEYSHALEAVRMAPSASNKQPWRIVKQDGMYHFYLKQNKGYAKGLGFNIQRVDMGIAMCHFEMTLEELGVRGSWQEQKPQINTENIEDFVYIISWIEEKEKL